MGEWRLLAFGRERCRKERGAAAVEFALVAPILFSLVFGIIGFGFVFAQELSLGNGARQGARFGVVNDATCQDIIDQTRSGAETINMAAANVQVVVYLNSSEPDAADTSICDSSDASKLANVPCQGSTTGDNLYVYARFVSDVSVPLLPISGQFPLQGTGVFRCEFSG